MEPRKRRPAAGKAVAAAEPVAVSPATPAAGPAGGRALAAGSAGPVEQEPPVAEPAAKAKADPALKRRRREPAGSAAAGSAATEVLTLASLVEHATFICDR